MLKLSSIHYPAYPDRTPAALLAVLALLMLAALSATPALAEDDPRDADPAASPGQLATLVEQLADDDYETREAATTELMQLELTDEQIADAFTHATLPEQTHRLRRVAMHRFYKKLDPQNASENSRAGGLGVLLTDPNRRILAPDDFDGLDHHGVFIDERIPGFPAFVHLRSGDIVVGIDDEMFDHTINVERGDPENFQSHLRSFRPGDEVKLNLVRNGRRVDVTLAMGNGERLNAFEMIRVDYRLYPRFLDYFEDLQADDQPSVIQVNDPD